jgi:hypothetical protein
MVEHTESPFLADYGDLEPGVLDKSLEICIQGLHAARESGDRAAAVNYWEAAEAMEAVRGLRAIGSPIPAPDQRTNPTIQITNAQGFLAR